MKILYLHPEAWSGEYPILRKLRELSHTVCALEEKRGLGQRRQLLPYFLEPGDDIATLWYDPSRGWEKVVTWPVDRFFKQGFNGRNLAHRMWVILEALRQFQPDAVISSEGFSYGVPAAFLKRLGALSPRLVVSYIGGDILDCPEADCGRRRTTITRWLIQQSLKGPEVLRPVSFLNKRWLLAEKATENRISVCPSHLVAPAEILADVYQHRHAIRALIREHYGISPEAPLIITLSSNEKGKGLHVLAKSWIAVKARLPDAHWLLAGPVTPWLNQAVLRDAGLASSVHVAGLLQGKAVFEHLAAADANINPSLCEGLNMVTVEAAAVGAPTITSDGAGIADWVQKADAGVVVPAGDEKALANAIIRFFEDDARRAQQSEHAHAMSREFSLDCIAAALLRLFANITTEKNNEGNQACL
ncbi:MAG TPA: hypothetical protein DEP05_02425 [Betaproteobacteria bacterium]|nr:hypothetical protein [Betaproteobacteria bacterium]